MRNKVAKKLKRNAEAMTVGKSEYVTRMTYKRLKKVHNTLKHTEK